MSIDAVGKLVRVTIAATYPDSQVQMNNLGYACTVAGGTDTRPALGAAVQTIFLANLPAVMAAVSSIYGWRVQTLSPAPPDLTVSGVNVVAGSVGQPIMPTQARPVLKWLTAMAGRRYRGRIYGFTPVNSRITSTGFPDATLDAAQLALGVALLPAIVSAGSTWKLSLIHRAAGSPVVYTSTLITNCEVASLFGTQRKSGNYGRENPAPW